MAEITPTSDYDYDVTLSEEKCVFLRHLLDKVCPATLTTSTTPATTTTTTVVPSIVALQPGSSSLNLFSLNDNTGGNSFTPSRDIQITSLGVYDPAGDGFITSKDVGIFNDFGGTTPNPNNPLVSVTIPAGSSPAGATFVADEVGGVGGTWFLPITPITLVSGTTYAIVGCCFPQTVTVEDQLIFTAPASYIIGQDLAFSMAFTYASGSTSITDTNSGITALSGSLVLGPNFEYN